MKLFELTRKRRNALGNFFLNMTVACMAVTIFEAVWWGTLVALLSLLCFFIITNGE